jgi:hypothetical protein
MIQIILNKNINLRKILMQEILMNPIKKKIKKSFHWMNYWIKEYLRLRRASKLTHKKINLTRISFFYKN